MFKNLDPKTKELHTRLMRQSIRQVVFAVPEKDGFILYYYSVN